MEELLKALDVLEQVSAFSRPGVRTIEEAEARVAVEARVTDLLKGAFKEGHMVAGTKPEGRSYSRSVQRGWENYLKDRDDETQAFYQARMHRRYPV